MSLCKKEYSFRHMFMLLDSTINILNPDIFPKKEKEILHHPKWDNLGFQINVIDNEKSRIW